MNLLNQHCQPLRGVPPLTAAQINELLPQVTGWQLNTGNPHNLEKTCAFKDFFETIAFVNALAWLCHREDHHPELGVTYNRCTVRFSTHSVGGVSMNDLICAAKVNALLVTA
jgi:4a-hydroxytetrahydrobiopterin dehydratase